MKKESAALLNALAEELSLNGEILFLTGDYTDYIVKNYPYSAVCLVYTKKSFTERGKTVTDLLTRRGVKPINFILPEREDFRLSQVFEMISVPDVVRAVVAFDSCVTDVCAYIATVLSAEFVFCPTDVKTRDVFARTLYPNGRFGEERFTAACRRTVITDYSAFSLEKTDLAELYATVVSYETAITDYAAHAFINDTELPPEIGVLKDALALVDKTENPALDFLYETALKIELINESLSGRLNGCSAEYLFLRAAKCNLNGFAFGVHKRIARLYAFYLREKPPACVSPDYNLRAETLAKACGADEGAFLRGLINQIRAFGRKKRVLADFITAQSQEIFENEDDLILQERVYNSLGGAPEPDFDGFIQVFRLLGDFPRAFNFFSLLREDGWTELI